MWVSDDVSGGSSMYIFPLFGKATAFARPAELTKTRGHTTPPINRIADDTLATIATGTEFNIYRAFRSVACTNRRRAPRRDESNWRECACGQSIRFVFVRILRVSDTHAHKATESYAVRRYTYTDADDHNGVRARVCVYIRRCWRRKNRKFWFIDRGNVASLRHHTRTAARASHLPPLSFCFKRGSPVDRRTGFLGSFGET